jgi:hypothetical protein
VFSTGQPSLRDDLVPLPLPWVETHGYLQLVATRLQSVHSMVRVFRLRMASCESGLTSMVYRRSGVKTATMITRRKFVNNAGVFAVP